MSISGSTDEALWRAALDGDEGAFGVLFDRHHRAVYNYCFRRTADWAAAEDLASVVFLETWRRRADVRLDHDSLLPWLYGVATNVLRNHQRALRRHAAALARMPRTRDEDDTEAVAARVDDRRRMREILDRISRLPRRHQDVLALCVWEELSYEQAAAALGVPVGTVRSRLNRAREKLREPLPTAGHRGREHAFREELS
ncbi:RNA polymerase sigma factor [Actinocorallia longicatena]|uniref:RNA polymerase sigma factor n=1 Tax=Actinocorallia longicatena TaxID=111803 RepID=UPI0031D1565B